MQLCSTAFIWIVYEKNYNINFVHFAGQSYFVNQYTKKSQWDRPTAPAEKEASDSEKVQASHLLVKHRDSRRPSSWREDKITRSKDEAIDILKGEASTE